MKNTINKIRSLLPNPFYTIAISAFLMPLLFQYNKIPGITYFELNIIELFVNGIIFFLLIYFIRKLAQSNETLKKSQEDTNALLSLFPEPVYIHDDKECLYANKEGFRLLGAEKESDLIGKHPLTYIHKNYHDYVINRMETVMSNNEISRNNEFKMFRLDGELMDIECSAVAFTYNNRPALITVINDVTTKKRATEEIIQKSDKLHLVGQMAAGIAHEIRNPLTSIKGFLQLMRGQNEKTNEYVEIMMMEIERINFIVNEFLVLAKPQAIVFEEKNLLSLVQNVLKLFHTQSVMYNVEIKLDFDLFIPRLNCDENQLKQVFINIIKNAVESMPNGGLLYIQIKKQTETNSVVIRFKDQGCGIPKERLKTLGEPFYTTKEKGTGLGLMVCYKIIENHLGQISFESEMGMGTTVEITLPLPTKELVKDHQHEKNTNTG